MSIIKSLIPMGFGVAVFSNKLHQFALFSDAKSPGQIQISEIAFELAFKYPQHFIRTFKQRTGHTPKENRSLN